MVTLALRELQKRFDKVQKIITYSRRNAKKKKPKGRPPIKFKKSFCSRVVKELAKGYSKEATAGYFKVSIETFSRWERENDDFASAIKTGLAQSRLYWESLGIDLATGVRKGNPSVWIFNMKNRFKWTDAPEKPVDKDIDQLKEMADAELELILNEYRKNVRTK